MGRLLGVLFGLVALVFLAGCGATPTVALLDWTFVPPGGEAREVRFPAHVDGWLPHAPCTYRLLRDVTLEPALRGRTLTLVLPTLPARARLWANGTEVADLDPLWESDYRSVGPHRFRIAPEATAQGELHLELEVRHVWTQSGWVDAVPQLSATVDGDPRSLVVRALNLTLSTTAFVVSLLMALSYAIIFLFGGRHRYAAWFVVAAAAGASYPAFLMGITQGLFGVYDAAVMGASMTLATYASVRFVHGHCGLGPPHWLWELLFAVVFVNAVVASGPFVATYVSGPAVMALMLVSAAYQTALFLRMVRTRRPTHVWLVPLAWPLATVSGFVDFAAWFGLGELLGGVRFGAGPGVLSLVQSVALSREFIVSARQRDELNRALAAQVDALKTSNDEIRLLNDELRRQVSQRSEEILSALRPCTPARPPSSPAPWWRVATACCGASGPAAWAWCTKPNATAMGAAWPSRPCPSPESRGSSSASSARRGRWPRCPIPTW